MRKYKATVIVIIMVMLIPFIQSCLDDYDDDIYDMQAGMPFNAALATVVTPSEIPGDREVAQDVLHDGFLNIFRSFSQFTYKGEGSLKAWLTRIMVNEALGYLRKKASTNQEVIVEELPDVIDGDEDDFEQIPQSVLMQFIKELPDGYRTVFNLYVLEEKGHKEIAEMLGITEHTSSSQLYRAKTLLMKKINDYRKRI